jgi:uncharacterized membrane protein (UPF0127 family)
MQMKKLALIALIALLFYTRFVNLGWGLPYPMHPDERNMAVAVQQLSCPNYQLPFPNYKQVRDCFNPHFFAYGQIPLYLAYGGVQLYHFVTGQTGYPTYIEATLALRGISALSSILLVFVLVKIIELVSKPNKRLLTSDFELWTLIFLIFQPYAIQFAHFGTTESLLMLLYSLIIYFSLKLFSTLDFKLSTTYLLLAGTFSGLALGTKTSSILFLGVPIVVIIIKTFRSFARLFISLFVFIFVSLFVFILSSPQSLLNLSDFISSMNYESAVGLGTYIPFYTRQFVGTVPVLFQFQKILPYVLGWPQFILGMLGFIFLPSFAGQICLNIILQVARVKGTRQHAQITRPIRHLVSLEYWRGKLRVTESAKYYDLLRFALLLSFLPPSFFFAKWTRFIAPSFPLFSLFALLFFIYLFQKVLRFKFQVPKFLLLFVIILPGLAYISIYASSDIRFIASDWIYKNIPANSKILTETANVIDLPVPPPSYQLLSPSYQINSFNFYDIDASPTLYKELQGALNKADYIIVPSRRIFANHTCLSPKSESLDVLKSKGVCSDANYKLRTTDYELLNKYYSDLFSGSLGFKQVAEFSSYPRIEIPVLRSTFPVLFNDENAEETWTVFDHPVIRVYKRSPKSESLKVLKSKSKQPQASLDFSDYKTTDLRLSTLDVRLLIADTPKKWEKGLMYVRNKQDIGGLDGMIFTFPKSTPLSFWNKNTLSHLTLYWINKGKIIGTSDMPSITQTNGVISTFSSPSEADTVIEVINE